MTLVNLFAAIYHNDEEQIKTILKNDAELVHTIFEEPKKFDHTWTNELYSLCDKDSKLDDPNYKQETALLFAARLGRKDVCKMLINEFDANVNDVNTYGHNAFMSAVNVETDENFDTGLMILENPELNLKHTTYGSYDALGQLLRNLQHFHSSKGGLSAKKAQELIDALLNKKDENGEKAFDLNKPQGKSGESAFLLACGAHSWIVVIYLITRGADYSLVNKYFHFDRDMYFYLTVNQFFTPKVKEELLGLLEKVIKSTDNAYGPYKRPEHLYMDFNGEPMEFDSKRYGE